jgi:hypothetical protein
MLTTRFIIIGQLGFLASLTYCVWLLPEGLSANDGISFYGDQPATLLPYNMAIASLVLSYGLFALTLPRFGSFKVLKYLMYLGLLSMVIILATPYKVSPSFHWFHVASTIALIAITVILALWLLFAVWWDSLNLVLLLGLSLATAVAFLYVRPDQGYLIYAETAFQLIFATMLARSVSKAVMHVGKNP